ncbi:MAG: carboxypeptidase M32 [Alphaproteobacteria bacterium]|nr:MAG: carboxypeptidase M32 [Alphaproteobacteria bacterium]
MSGRHGPAEALEALRAHQRQTEALAQIAGRLSWDQETVMPRGAAEQRSEEMAAIEAVLHARRADPRIGEWLEAIGDEGLDARTRAELRLVRRAHARATRVPERLAAEIARVTSVAQGVWADARRDEDVGAFLPTLAEVVRLKRDEAAALAGEGSLYDALLDDYEPGIDQEWLSALFGRMRPRLVALRERVLEAAASVPLPKGTFPPEAQTELARACATAFGYDWTRGRLDFSVHPFSSGSGDDVRITTRIAADDPFNCIYSTIHETGHACYEQGIDRAYRLTPLGRGVSMGVHESQSRIYENQMGRGRGFTGWLFDEMRGRFGDFGISDRDVFYRAVNRVATGYIRTEADEVHYNLHVLLRFDLERDLIEGRLDVADLETAWNERFERDFGRKVDRPSNGVLQDVHWSVGLFGYFPTYTLGNVYAGCLWKALRAEVADVDDALAAGDPSPATAWLREKVQRHGALLEPVDLVTQATGSVPGEGPLLDYLEEKFLDLYG